MASKEIGADMNYAWPTAQIAVMGAKGAVEIIFRADIGDADKIAARTKEYEDRFLSPFIAAERGYIDDVIMPHSTRRRIARALAMLQGQEGRDAGEEARQFAVVREVRRADYPGARPWSRNGRHEFASRLASSKSPSSRNLPTHRRYSQRNVASGNW